MSDTTRIAALETATADMAAYLDELRVALASHDSALGSIRLAELEQKISPSLPGAPTAQAGGGVSLAGVDTAYAPTVAMGSAGLFITGGAINASNAGSTVIIDGTSDMFKIAATGTQSGAFPNATYTVSDYDTTLTALGNGYSVTPAALWSQYFATAPDSSSLRSGSLLVANDGTGHIAYMAIDSVMLSSGYVVMRLRVACVAANKYGNTAYVRYYVLVEVGV
jgi:hypothetical protein